MPLNVLFTLLLLVIAFRGARADDAPQAAKMAMGPRLDTVKQAWEVRDAAMRHCLLEWSEEHTHPQGTLISPRDSEPISQDQRVEFEKRLIVRDDFFRVEGKGKAIDSRTKRMDPFQFTAVLRGTGSSFHDFPEQKNNLGYSADSAKDLLDASYRPAMLAINPIGQEFGRLNLDEYSVEPGVSSINERPCLKLKRSDSQADAETLYLDQERGFLVNRVVTENGGHVSRQTDFTYVANEAGIWCPATWQLKIMKPVGDGYSLLISAHVKRFDAEYVAPLEDFEIKFPAGTLIHDLRTKDENRIDIDHSGNNGESSDDRPAYIDQFRAIRKDTDDRLKPIHARATVVIFTESSPAGRDRVMDQIRVETEAIFSESAAKVLDLVRPHAADAEAVTPLVWIVESRSPTHASAAAELLTIHHSGHPRTIELAKSSARSASPWVEPMLRAQLAAPDLPPDQNWRLMFSLAMFLQSKAELSVRLSVASDEDVARFERLNGKDCLADMRNADIAKLEDEAVSLFNAIEAEFPSQELRPGLTVADVAKSSVFQIRNLGVGKTAPDISGEDTDGVDFKLSDYRGKAVVLSFWASWCEPCMELVPHERELAELYKDKRFAIVGVNADQDKATLQQVLSQHQISWRSFWCGKDGWLGSIPKAWNVNSLPTTYLIDHRGVIRGINVKGSAFDAMVKQMVSDAEIAAQ